MKKSIVLVFLLTGILLVGSVVSADVTIKYGIWDKNQQPAMQNIIDEFNKEYPDIEVKVEVTPWSQYWTKLQVAATGGALPDVFWMNGANFPLYASNGILVPLNDRVEESELDLSNFYESLTDLYSLDGELYGIPKDFDTIGLWYNKELFDAAGVEYPDDTWDWDKLKEAAEKLTNDGVYGIAAANANQENYYNTIYQNGGYVVGREDGELVSGYDDPATIGGLKFWIDLIDAGVSPTLAQMTDTSPLDLFASGKVAMMYTGSWNQIFFLENEFTKDKVDVAVLPKAEQRAVVIHGLANVMGSKSKHKEEAWKFLQFLGSKKAAQIQADTGTVIPAYKGTQDAWVNSNDKFNLQAFVDMVDYSVPLPGTLYTQKWRELEIKYFNQAWAGEISIEEAAEKVAAGMNKILATE